MSILRERQIQEILDSDNFFNRIVLERQKAHIKDYEENIKRPQVLDTSIVATNKNKINDFITLLNNLLIRLKSFDLNLAEELTVFSNKNRSEYRKFLTELNITKPFQLWEDLMNEYTKPGLNEQTKESILIGLQKILPYLKTIINYSEKEILSLSYIVAYSEDNEHGDKIIDKDELFHLYMDYDYDEYDEYNREIIDLLTNINAINIIVPFIESCAFYRCVENAIEKNRLQPLTKQDIAFDISQIINEISLKSDYEGDDIVVRVIADKFNDSELPDLVPYFRAGRDAFTERFRELDSMNGRTENSQYFQNPIQPFQTPDFTAPIIPPAPPIVPPAAAVALPVGIPPIPAGILPAPVAPADDEDEDEALDREFARFGEGKPKKKKYSRRKYKKNISKNVSDALNFNDENNEMYNDNYNSDKN